MALGLQNASDRQAGRQAEAPCLMPEGEGREAQQMGERGMEPPISASAKCFVKLGKPLLDGKPQFLQLD